MRNRTDRFIKALQTYLAKAISERVEEINAEDPSINLPDIALWQTGYSGVLSGLSHYPGCIILVNGKTLVDPYTTAYSVVIGIGLTADDPDYLETLGRVYEDIIEDVIRSDWSLGNTCLDTDLGVQFQSDNVSNVYLIQAQLTCQVDLGGFVYQPGDEPWRKDLAAKASAFFSNLDEETVSSYLIGNSTAIMQAFGVSKDDDASSIGTAIYNTLQSGKTVSVLMDDGGVLNISGHFDEGGTDTWHMEIVYEVPSDGTDRCFPEGSPYSVKGGSVRLIADPAEITETMEYDMAVCVYGYQVDITGVTVNNGESEFTLDVVGLTKPEDFSHPCIIDPNGATYEISLHDFTLPPADADGTIKVNGEDVAWSEMKPMIARRAHE